MASSSSDQVKSQIKPTIVSFGYKNFNIDHVKRKWMATCCYCSKLIQETQGTTSGFTRHLERKHTDMYSKYTERMHRSEEGQTTITSMLGKPVAKYGQLNEEQLKITRSLVENLVVGCGFPMSIVENKNFVAFMADVNSKYNMPARSTLTSKLIPMIRDRRMEKVKSLTDEALFISLTIDIWTDRRMHSYIAMTAHTFVKFCSKSMLLYFGACKGSHTGSKIASEIENVIEKKNLSGKIVYIVTDNASNMKKACELISLHQQNGEDDTGIDDEEAEDSANTDDFVIDDDSLFEDLDQVDHLTISQTLDAQCVGRLPCFAHTLQLALKDGLDKCASIRPVTGKCTKLSSLCHQSATFKERFEAAFGEIRTVPTANATRWSSTYHQLSTVADLDQDLLKGVLRETGHGNLILSAKDEASLRELVEILSPWAEITTLIQGDQYPTVGCVVPSILGLLKSMNSMVRTVKYHVGLVRSLLESVNQRFSGLLVNLKISEPHSSTSDAKPLPFSERVYVVAASMDPNYGFVWLDADHPGTDVIKSSLKQTVIDWTVGMARSIGIQGSLQPQPQQSGDIAVSQPVSQLPPAKKARTSIFSSYRQLSHETSTITTSTTRPLTEVINSYFSEIRTITNSCTAARAWDQLSQGDYACLLPLFEHVFCAPCTSAPVERVFSHGGLFVRPHRARLGDKTLCDLMLAKCN